MRTILIGRLLFILALSLVIVSCQSEHDKLIEERDNAIDELNELRRDLEENVPIRHESDLYDLLVKQKSLIDKIKRLSIQLMNSDDEPIGASEQCMTYDELKDEISKASHSGYSGLIDTRLLDGVFEELDSNSCLFK